MSRSTSPATVDMEALMVLAIRQARRVGLQQADAQDCAMEFVQRLAHLFPSGHRFPRTWALKAAYHQAISYRRYLNRLQLREQTYPASAFDPAEADLAWHASPASDPYIRSLRQALWAELRQALGKLTTLQRDLFVSFHLRHHSVPDIAARLGRTPNAVYVGLIDARKRLAVLLQRAGWTLQEAQQLFQTPPRAVPMARFTPSV